jgi:hypothetical protein
MRRKHGVAGTLGDHDVGGGASDLEDDASLRNRTGLRAVSVFDRTPDLVILPPPI